MVFTRPLHVKMGLIFTCFLENRDEVDNHARPINRRS